MTLQLLDVRDSASGTSYGSIPVGSPGTRDYYIKSIDGLGPVDAVMAMSNFADYDGAVHHGGHLAQRNIVLTLGYSPNYSNGKDLGALRRQAYSWFRPKALTRLIFTDSAIETRVDVHAYVEKITPVMFSKDPEVQVSLICEDPYFASISGETITATANDNINLSSYGDAPTPYVLTLTTGAAMSRIDIRNGVDSNIIIARTFLKGDVIRVSVVPGSKYASLTRGGVVTPLLDRLQNSTLNMFIDSRVTAFNVVTPSKRAASYTLSIRKKWLGL